LSSQNYTFNLDNDIVYDPEYEIRETSNRSDCLGLDVNDIINNCKEVWIGVNIHFFLNQDCEGEISGDKAWCYEYLPDYYPGCDFSGYNLHNIAASMISRANAFAENISDNIPFPNEFVKTGQSPANFQPQCFPLRFLLKGVHVHCVDNTVLSNTFFQSLEVNPSQELNIFIKDVPGTINGYTSYGIDEIISESLTWAAPSVLWHEFAHTAYVNHPWEENPELSDTWNTKWQWDHDCNSGTPFVKGNACWDANPTYNYNGKKESACNNPHFCTDHPCCSWDNQSTNLMAYSGWASNGDYATFSKQQLTKLLGRVNLLFCEKVVAVDPDCPPPSAVIYTPPMEGVGDDCSYCIQFGASMNESSYIVTFTEKQNGTEKSVSSTGWINRSASSYCINLSPLKSGSGQLNGGFRAGHTYTVSLKVKNDCGMESLQSTTFTLPEAKNCTKQPVDIEIAPNPATEYADIKLTTHTSSNITIAYSHSVFGLYNTQNLGIKEAGVINVRQDVSYWYSGINFIHVITDEGIYSHTIIKD